MKKKAIILDLDNTIYPVSSIGEKLFKSLFDLIEERGEYFGDLEAIKAEIMRRPFQYVAKDYSFSVDLFKDSVKLLGDLTYEEPMSPFDDYKYVQALTVEKFLVTAGFTKMQESKVKQLKIKDDFKGIYIIDPSKTNLVKKDMFLKIMDDYSYDLPELLVIGDDLDSEIKAAAGLGIDAILYDRKGEYHGNEIKTIRTFADLVL